MIHQGRAAELFVAQEFTIPYALLIKIERDCGKLVLQVCTFFLGPNPSKQFHNRMLHEQTGAWSCHRLSLTIPPPRLLTLMLSAQWICTSFRACHFSERMKGTRHGLAFQALRIGWECSQLPPIVRFVPRLKKINLRRKGLGEMWDQGCFVEEPTKVLCLFHFKF